MELEIKWEGSIEGWTYNFLKKNYWKISKIHEWEDAIQSAKLVFLETKHHYGKKVDTPQWFMALYKKVLWSWLVDEAKKSSGYIPPVEEVENSIPTKGQGDLLVLIQQAPEEIKSVLQLVFNTPVEVFEAFSKDWKSRGKKKEMGNQYLCSMLGYNSGKVDLVSKTQDYFLS